ncbi:MAG: diacylglycerol kinase family protein [Wenzhouxiangellaceae bacterium]
MNDPVPQSPTTPAGRELVLISNPLSFTNARSNGGIEALEQQVKAIGGQCLRIDREHSPQQAVAAALSAGGRLLIANGGDGTIQGVISAVLQQQPEGIGVAVLPGGRTNVIAADLGLSGAPHRLLPDLLNAWRGGRLPMAQRHTLKVQIDQQPPEYGFLLNGGGLAHFIEDCWDFRERYRRWGLHGGLGTGSWVVGRLLAGLLGRRLFSPVQSPLYWQGEHWRDTLTAFSVTTNQHLPLGISPYREDSDSPLKASAIAGEARHVAWRLLVAMLANGRGLTPERGFISGQPESLTITAAQPLRYHLDGESHAMETGQQLTVALGPKIALYAPGAAVPTVTPAVE